MNSLLRVNSITKEFSGVKYLNNVSFTLNKGDFFVLAGANGSGKTLLIKHLNGLFPIKKDTIYLNGVDCYKKEGFIRQKIGLVFQNPETQIVSLNVKEDVAFGLFNSGLNKNEIKNRVQGVLEDLEITHLGDRNPFTLSGGELKRVTIAGVLVMEPEIIILDEPFIGLDYPGVIDVIKAILDLQKLNKTIVIITHDLSKILKYTTKIGILNNGELVFIGAPQNSLELLEKNGIRRPNIPLQDMTWLK
jgi:biotin transport system ATP-binding protein